MFEIFGQDKNLITRICLESSLKGNLYLGNIWSAEEVQTQNADKIGAVLTVASGTELSYPPSAIKHKVIQAEDNPQFDLSPSFDEGVEFIERQLQETNVLVHCFAGVSRSASLILAYLMKKQGMSLTQALSLIQQKRPIAGPNTGFIKQLEKYEISLKKPKLSC